MIDQTADFSGYIGWLEEEIKRRGLDQMYVPVACTKDENDPITGKKIGVSRYDERNGWIDGYIRRWLTDPAKEHISILGEFGTGKTWFALHFAWETLQDYNRAKREGIERPRLPLVIPLRDYAKAVSVESLFSEFFFRKHEIPLPGYSVFELLNRMGKLLLIFEGFDEMAARIDRQQMINNFWELARVIVPGAKAILTCRTEHFPEAQEGRALLNAELQASVSALTGEPPQFEVLELEKFNDNQIRQLLSFRANHTIVDRVMCNPQLLDLARRPVMTELILEALPEIEEGKPVDISHVYLYAVRRKMERDIKEERTFTSLADKIYFMCELSWEMLSTNQMSLNYRLFPDRIRRLFGSIVREQKDLDHWHYDMMGQTLLIRNADGDYTPAHRSFLEFFVAYKFTAELGILASDFIELSRMQQHIDHDLPPQLMRWSQYFQRQIDQSGNVESISPVSRFVMESPEVLNKTVFSKWIDEIIREMMASLTDLQIIIEDEEHWSLNSNSNITNLVLDIIRRSLLLKRVDKKTQRKLGRLVIKFLSYTLQAIISNKSPGKWQHVLPNLSEVMFILPMEKFAPDFRKLYKGSQNEWWHIMLIRILGKKGIDVLAKDIIEGIESMDEIMLGRAICYLGEINSRLFIESPSIFPAKRSVFLEIRSLYYYWMTKSDHFRDRLQNFQFHIVGKILVSDDDPSVRQLMDVILKEHGLECISCGSPIDTIQIIAQEKISLLITDIMKPVMDGIEMIDHIRNKLKSDLPIIVCSANWHSVYRYIEPIKIDFVVGKPFQVEHLLAVIDVLLGRSLDPQTIDLAFQYLY